MVVGRWISPLRSVVGEQLHDSWLENVALHQVVLDIVGTLVSRIFTSENCVRLFENPFECMIGPVHDIGEEVGVCSVTPSFEVALGHLNVPNNGRNAALW